MPRFHEKGICVLSLENRIEKFTEAAAATAVELEAVLLV